MSDGVYASQCVVFQSCLLIRMTRAIQLSVISVAMVSQTKCQYELADICCIKSKQDQPEDRALRITTVDTSR